MIANPSSTTLRERLAAVLGLLSVALGAMAAHALESRLALFPKGAGHWATAAHYHGLHAVALYFIAGKNRPTAYWCMFSGVIIFCGTLYTLALTDLKWLGAITPIGGTLIMLGWLLLALKPKEEGHPAPLKY
jgi:uncharacterized membrane protein YgdD (TMEM256/DUF423 family)